MLNFDPAYGMNTDNVTTDELRAFVGTNAHYYIQKFPRFTILGKEKFCITWNWSSCGFTFLWFLYRKMYALAVISFVIFCIPGINFLMHIVVGVLGNYLYYRHCKAKIHEIRFTQTQQNFIPVLQEVGGVNKWVITVGVILGILLTILIAIFFSTMIAFMGHHMDQISI